MKNKFERNIDDFCDNGNLENYRSLIIQIFKEIEKYGCSISKREDSVLESSHSHNNENCWIKVSLKKKYSSPLELIFTILHEFGHHFDPLPIEFKNNIDKKIQCELKAWVWAFNRMIKIDTLKGHTTLFFECWAKYMESYYKKKFESA